MKSIVWCVGKCMVGRPWSVWAVGLYSVGRVVGIRRWRRKGK